MPTIHIFVRDPVLIFLHIIGHNVRFRVIGSRFHRSTKTVHRYFKVVLKGILKLYRVLIRLPSKDTPREIKESKSFYPYFKINIGIFLHFCNCEDFLYFLNHYICRKLGLCWSNRWHTCSCICSTWNTRKVSWSQRLNHSKFVSCH